MRMAELAARAVREYVLKHAIGTEEAAEIVGRELEDGLRQPFRDEASRRVSVELEHGGVGAALDLDLAVALGRRLVLEAERLEDLVLGLGVDEVRRAAHLGLGGALAGAVGADEAVSAGPWTGVDPEVGVGID